MDNSFSKILRRLDLIRSMIILEDEEEIVTQVLKLKQYSQSQEIDIIITLLENKSYSQAMNQIEALIKIQNQVSIYIDSELEALKLEVEVLEKKVNILSNEKADLEKLIHEFGLKHNRELGELLLKILSFRKQKAKGTPAEDEAEKDYNEYNYEYEISKNEKVADLTEEDLKHLKQMYRKASKLCHPDVVNEMQKELADKMFAELNAAYEKNDLQGVRNILEILERGDFFVNKSDSINEKKMLRIEINKLQLLIINLMDQVQVIKESETFGTITNIENWDTYFNETKQKLADQVKDLENARK
jgi:hypothetical protein